MHPIFIGEGHHLNSVGVHYHRLPYTYIGEMLRYLTQNLAINTVCVAIRKIIPIDIGTYLHMATQISEQDCAYNYSSW